MAVVNYPRRGEYKKLSMYKKRFVISEDRKFKKLSNIESKYFDKSIQILVSVAGLLLLSGIVYGVVNKDILVVIPSMQSLSIEPLIEVRDFSDDSIEKKSDQDNTFIFVGALVIFLVGATVLSYYSPTSIGLSELNSVIGDIKSNLEQIDREIVHLSSLIKHDSLKLRALVHKCDLKTCKHALASLINNYPKKK